MQTVGVAPGTTTIMLGEVYPNVAAKSINWIKPRPCPPEEKRWFMPDRAMDASIHQHAYPNGFQGLANAGPRVMFYDYYANDFWKLRGMHGLGQVLDRPLRWDLIGIVGGGAFAVALLTGLIASAITPSR